MRGDFILLTKLYKVYNKLTLYNFMQTLGLPDVPDPILIHGNAYIWNPFPGLNLEKLGKKQKIDSVFWVLEYDPKKGHEGSGIITISTKERDTRVNIRKDTGLVTSIVIRHGQGSRDSIELHFWEDYHTHHNERMATLQLTQTVTALARKVLELQGELTQLRRDTAHVKPYGL